MSTPASKAVINGVRVSTVAVLVSGRDVRCTPAEFRIALKVQRLGEEMERKGYLPMLRRRAMLRKIVDEANRVPVPPHGRGIQPDGGVGSGALAERPVESAQV